MARRRMLATGLVLLVVIAPSRARADTLLIPFIGLNFGGDAGKTISESFEASQFNWGVSFAFMGGGFFGFEQDFGFSPDFYGKNDAGGSSVLTIMSNFMVGLPFGGQQGFGVRPYGLGGIGLMRSSAEFTDVGENNITWSAGGGIMVFFGSCCGVRFDVRYFRTFDDLEIAGVQILGSPGKIEFTRSSLGFVFRF